MHLFILSSTYVSQSTMSTDPRDKIYGMYGLLGQKIDRLPAADHDGYENKLNGLYEDFVRALIKSTEKFWPASMSIWRTEPVKDLPSWVPDFRYNSKVTTETITNSSSLFFYTNDHTRLDCQYANGTRPTWGAIALKRQFHSTITRIERRWPPTWEQADKHIITLLGWICFRLASAGSGGVYNNYRDIFSALKELPTICLRISLFPKSSIMMLESSGSSNYYLR
jgi:hypothetical protein